MKIKTRIKLWYYNSFLSVFLISHFQIWCKFTLDELLEIPLMKVCIDSEIVKFQKEGMVSYSFILAPYERETMNGLILSWIDKSGYKHENYYILSPQFNFNKHRWVLKLC